MFHTAFIYLDIFTCYYDAISILITKLEPKITKDAIRSLWLRQWIEKILLKWSADTPLYCAQLQLGAWLVYKTSSTCLWLSVSNSRRFEISHCNIIIIIVIIIIIKCKSCQPVAVVILHVHKTWNCLLLDISLEGYMRSMWWQLGMLGTISAFAYRHRETKKNLCRGGRSQDLPSTDF